MDSETQSVNIVTVSPTKKLTKKISFLEPSAELKPVNQTITERGIEYSELLDKCLKFVPNNENLLTEKIYQHCFTHAKMAKAPSGNNRSSIEKDKKRMLHLNFIEFVVFLCLLSYEVEKD